MGSGESQMDLNQVTSEKDLGITFQDDLQFTKHLSDKVKKANSILGLIHRSFQHIDNEMLIHLYKALVRPHVEYASSVWSPFKLRDIKLIEGVQRRATRLSRDLRNEPYNIRLTTLGLPTLQFRRERADMLQVFKILNGYEDIDSGYKTGARYSQIASVKGSGRVPKSVHSPVISSTKKRSDIGVACTTIYL